ncbi:MAG: hypothetical protein K1X95_04455 [Acidimicrobiia bacterium]|nr:hypothetical protein [Acidimicrobiia bacterium]
MRIVLEAERLRTAADRIDAAAHRADAAVASLVAAAASVPVAAESAPSRAAAQDLAEAVGRDTRALHDAFDGPQAAQLRALADLIEAMDRPTWTSDSVAEALLLSPLVLAAHEATTDADRAARGLLVPDIDYWRGVRPGELPPVLPWVRSGDGELADLTQPNLETFDAVVDEAGRRAREDGRPWVVSVVVGATMGAWAPLASGGRSRGVTIPGLTAEDGARTDLAVRPVHMTVAASNGEDVFVREVPARDRLGRSWIVGRGVGSEAGVSVTAPGVGAEAGSSSSRAAGGYHGDAGTGWRYEVVPTRDGAVAVPSNMSPLLDGETGGREFRLRALDGSGR